MRLLYAGLLYLAGIAVILTLKPSLMFSPNGAWKEFGIGRSRERYTWMPFWLFAVMWAILSYLIVLMLSPVVKKEMISIPTSEIEPDNVSNKAMKPAIAATRGDTMKKGYYILDTNETMKRGVPKYIYLGPEAPNMVYHETEDSA